MSVSSGNVTQLQGQLPIFPPCNYRQATKQVPSGELGEMVGFQGICIFSGLFALSCGYLLYENEFGVFTMTTPVLIGLVGAVLFWAYICASDWISCSEQIFDYLTSTIWSLVEKAWDAFINLFRFR